MKYAVVKDNLVENIIVAREDQKEELESALNAALEPCTIYDLTIGDLWNGEKWTRNANGEQVVVPLVGVPIEDRVASLEDAVSILCMPDAEV